MSTIQHTSTELVIALPQEDENNFHTTLMHDYDRIQSAISKIDVANAQATEEADRAMIMAALEAGVGKQKTNELVLAALRDWLAHRARTLVQALDPQRARKAIKPAEQGGGAAPGPGQAYRGRAAV